MLMGDEGDFTGEGEVEAALEVVRVLKELERLRGRLRIAGGMFGGVDGQLGNAVREMRGAEEYLRGFIRRHPVYKG